MSRLDAVSVDTNAHGVLRMPRELFFGAGCTKLAAEAIAELGDRPLIIVDSFLRNHAVLQEIVAELGDRGRIVDLFSDIEPELPRSCIDRAVAAAKDFSPDVIIGFGGGSSLDLAKVVSLMLVASGELSDYYGENKVPRGVVPIVAIPTTSGTGSEVTPVAVIADPDRELKVGISSPHLVPTLSFVDPDLAVTCPPPVTAFAGIDALCHAIESFTSKVRTQEREYPLPVFVGANALSADASLRATTLIMGNLQRAFDDGFDYQARASMSLGSTLAGIAFASGGTHVGHAVQYPVGAMTKTPHGLGVGLLLPYVLEAILPIVPDAVAAISAAVNKAAGEEDEPDVRRALRRVIDLRKQIGVPHTLADIGVRETDLARVETLTASVQRLVANAPGDEPERLVSTVVRCAWSGQSDFF